MKIIVASDSFKESLSSSEVNNIIESGILKVWPEAEVTKISIADGGEGTIDSILSQVEGEIYETEIQGPLPEIKVRAKWILINKGKDAVIESASAVGLWLIPPDKRDPGLTSTYGIGQLINEAVGKNAERIYLGLGGSSTNDAGAGIAQALGIKLLDKDNRETGPGGKTLLNLAKIDVSGINHGILNTKIICLCDVENTLCGPLGASFVFAPQKGALTDDVMLLDQALNNFAEIVKNNLKRDILEIKGGGAAGGIAAGMMAFFDTEIKSGINTIMDIINFDSTIENADLIITGEGKIDMQTLFGKTISGITGRAKKKRKPVIAFCGILGNEKEMIMNKLGLLNIFPLVNEKVTKQDSIRNPERYLSERVYDAMNRIKNKI